MSQTPATLLSLPLEIRLQIYEIVLDKSIGYIAQFYLSISLACRQIRQEVLPILFGQHHHFSDLEHMWQWTSAVNIANPNLLHHVQDIALRIDDTCQLPVQECLDMPKKTGQPQRHTTEWWQARYIQLALACGAEPVTPKLWRRQLSKFRVSVARWSRQHKNQETAVSRIWNAITLLPKPTKLWIMVPENDGLASGLFFPVGKDAEIQLVLEMVGAAYQDIQEFSCFSNSPSLAYLGQFHALRELQFSGYSRSTPADTLDILRSLKYLDTITIWRYPRTYDSEDSIEYLSMTAEVLEKMNPLKSFQLSHMTSHTRSNHMTVPMIAALAAHRDSLRILSINCDRVVEEDVLQELLNLTVSSRPTQLDIRLMIRITPSSLRSVELLRKTIGHDHVRFADHTKYDIAGSLKFRIWR